MNRFLSLSLLLTVGVLSGLAQRPRNIILMVGDGMGVSQLSTAFYYQKEESNFSRFPVVGLSRTSSAKEKITDSAAGATAFSTGQKTYNGAIAVDTNKQPIPTILEQLAAQGLATGIVATSSVTHATPASFYAHVPSRHQHYDIAEALIEAPVDFFAGGGRKYFNDDLLARAQAAGWQLYTDSLGERQPGLQMPLGYLLSEDGLPRARAGRGNFLSEATARALELLQERKEGFFLVVEASQIDWGGHANEADYIIEEVLDFDRAVGKALQFAEEQGNTLVIVTADHETGGFTLSSASKRVPFQGERSDYSTISPTFSTGGHSAAMVPVLAFGPGADIFSGIYQNTAIYHKMMDWLLAPTILEEKAHEKGD